MNRIFDINRFGRYFATDLRSCLSNYGLNFLLISLMGVIIYIGTIIAGLIFNGTWAGPSLGFRATTFAVCMFVLMLTMPVKCYGMITARKDGSDWLMLPVSKMEKFLSMVIMTIFIAPAASAAIYLGLDAIMCAADNTCGNGILASIGNMLNAFTESAVATDNDIAAFPAMGRFVRQISNPLLYIDDIAGGFLIFLLGAVVFKRSKSAKTIVAMTAASIVFGIILTPALTWIFPDLSSIVQDSPEAVNNMFTLDIFRHAALIDTVNDTIVNLALSAGIYFRISTLKH